MEKVIVTGGAGFIGSNLCRALHAEGYHVVTIDNLSAGTLENVAPGVEFHKADICDADLSSLFRGASTVFHLAAKNCLADCAENPVETARNNVFGTTRVLEAAVAAKVSHFIYADTSAEYEGIEVFPSTVNTVKPLSIYACSKRGGALMADAFSHLHGLSVSTVRYFNVYGPAQDWRRVIPPVMSAFTMKLLSGQSPFIYGTGEKRRDFIHVDDINRFHLMLLRDRSLRGGIYNLGSGVDHSILEIFQFVENYLQTGLKPIFKPELPAEALRTLADISETSKTGWKPAIGIEAGIATFIEYTKARLAKEAEPKGKENPLEKNWADPTVSI